MKNVDHIFISIGKKPFGGYKVISDYAFKNDLVTLIYFNNQKFIWIPTWKEVGAIIKALYTAENINRVKRGKPELSFFEHLSKMNIDEYIKEIKPC